MTDPTEQVRFYSQAILLKPDFAAALINRGVARALQGNQASALQDYDEACRAQPAPLLHSTTEALRVSFKGIWQERVKTMTKLSA